VLVSVIPQSPRERLAIGVLSTTQLTEAVATQGALHCVSRLRKPGNYRPRYLSYLAGRAIISGLLKRENLALRVEPDLRYGFLRLVTSAGEVTLERFVNVSHTQGMAVAALGPTPIGIDVESLSRDATRALGRVTSEGDLLTLPPTVVVSDQVVSASLALWCAKEAISKALGLGIVFGMNHFHVDFSQASPYPVVTDITGPLTVKNPAISFTIRGTYLFAVCTSRENFLKPVDWIDDDEILRLSY